MPWGDSGGSGGGCRRRSRPPAELRGVLCHLAVLLWSLWVRLPSASDPPVGLLPPGSWCYAHGLRSQGILLPL